MRLPLALLIVLSGCGYQPPPQADTTSPTFVADRAACEDSASVAVNKQNAKTGLAWFASPVRRWGQISDATSACMAGKGYGRLRWCTAAELSDGSGQARRVVTAAGVQCEDQPTK